MLQGWRRVPNAAKGVAFTCGTVASWGQHISIPDCTCTRFMYDCTIFNPSWHRRHHAAGALRHWLGLAARHTASHRLSAKHTLAPVGEACTGSCHTINA
jgi:hypothetical protein